MPIRLRSPKTDLELFHKEAMTGNLSQLRDFLQHQNELLYRTNTDSGGTALHVAARCGNWKAVELFLNPPFNANRSAENWSGHNALYCALMNASVGLENHVNMLGGLNFRNSRGRPPLMESCRLRHLDVLRTLIRLQFARNAWVRQNPLSLAVKCDGGKTALHYALSFGDKRGRRRLKKGRTTRLFGREQREEELDEDEPGYAAFLKSDGYEENFSRG